MHAASTQRASGLCGTRLVCLLAPRSIACCGDLAVRTREVVVILLLPAACSQLNRSAASYCCLLLSALSGECQCPMLPIAMWRGVNVVGMQLLWGCKRSVHDDADGSAKMRKSSEAPTKPQHHTVNISIKQHN